MKRQLLVLAATLGLAGCAAGGGYASAEYVYAEPVEYEYVVPVDRVVVVTREVLVTRGWTVYRVQRSGPNRIIWARRGDDQVVRILRRRAASVSRCAVCWKAATAMIAANTRAGPSGANRVTSSRTSMS